MEIGSGNREIARNGARLDTLTLMGQKQQIVKPDPIYDPIYHLATRVLKQRKFTVTINLNAGPSVCRVLTSDLSLDYVKINADYRS